ncbi:MAG: SAM-dependent methyltransferase [Alphaproteobacteria bacterium]|nr:SAM-dependent methyltransferase [Alphaproteobacteria bacterium]
MSGFSSHWLSLREPIDHQSRNTGLQHKLAQHFATQETLALVDLGSGTGSNLRALAPHLPNTQSWRLIDYDRDLLQTARHVLRNWADQVIEDQDVLQIQKGGKTIHVQFETHDLAQGIGPLIQSKCELVTAAAFFDLVSAPWIEKLCRDLAHAHLPLFTVLTYDGDEQWTPPHKADQAMLEAFHQHQASDKGFGAAAGPKATALLSSGFKALGYQVEIGSSAWVISSANQDLISALATGSAQAVRETGLVDEPSIEDWLAQHRSARQCKIGHQDLFAWLK